MRHNTTYWTLHVLSGADQPLTEEQIRERFIDDIIDNERHPKWMPSEGYLQSMLAGLVGLGVLTRNGEQRNATYQLAARSKNVGVQANLQSESNGIGGPPGQSDNGNFDDGPGESGLLEVLEHKLLFSYDRESFESVLDRAFQIYPRLSNE